jgi:cysteine desulfurase/selenocysteine lyase
VKAIRACEVTLTQSLIEGLRAIPGVTVYGTLNAEQQTATVSFNIDGMAPSEVGLRLDDEYGIQSRVGLHCAPTAHKTLGTFPTGTVRFGLSAFNTAEEVQAAIVAVRRLKEEAS